MDTYTDPRLLDVAAALTALPALPLGAAEPKPSLDLFAPLFAPNPGQEVQTLVNSDNSTEIGTQSAAGGRLDVNPVPVKRKSRLSHADNRPTKSGRAALHLCERNHRVAVGVECLPPSL
jgi:hypothetical protein